MTRDDILAAVQAIYFGTTDTPVVSGLLDKLEGWLPHSNICDLIFQDLSNPTPEQVVDEAMRREADYLRQLDHD